MDTKEEKKPIEQKEYATNRFDLEFYVNDNIICARNFRINYFNEQSMYSVQMKQQMDGIVREIEDDLKSKTRIFLWYYFDEEQPCEDLEQPMAEPWEYTLKIVVKDEGKVMYERIFDGRWYPRAVRDKIDLSNKYIDIRGKKIELANIDANRLYGDVYASKAMMQDRKDLILSTIKSICEVCSPSSISIDENGKVQKSGDYSSDYDYDLEETYRTIISDYKEDKEHTKTYILSRKERYDELVNDLDNYYRKKTRDYFLNECNGMFTSPKRKDDWKN